MDWLTLIIISLFTFAVATTYQKTILTGSKINEILYSIVFQLGVSLVFLFIGVFFTGLDFPDLQGYELNIAFMVIFYASSNLFGFMALKGMDASKYIVILTTRGLFTVLASSLFLGEFLDGTQWIGAVFIIIAAIVVTIDKPEKLKLKFNKFEIFAFLTAISFGFANTNDRILLDKAGIEVVPYMFIAFLLPPLLITLIRRDSLKDLKFFDRKEILKTIVFVVLISVSAGTLFAAYAATDNSSQVATVNLLSTVLIVIFGIVILKEREGIPRKIIGTILSLIGLFLVI